MSKIRVALFACAYNEIDGVANTMLYFEGFAMSHDLPMLNIHGGFEHYCQRDGSVQRLELKRRWPKFQIDYQHDYDLNLWRYLPEGYESMLPQSGVAGSLIPEWAQA